MKNSRTIISLLVMLTASTAWAQDTTSRSVTGLRFSLEAGLQENKSLTIIQQQLRQANVDASAIGNVAGNIVLSFVRDKPRHVSETRFLGTLPLTDGVSAGAPVRRASFYGLGFGFSDMYKLVDTRRFLVGPLLGFDFMWYRLSLLPLDRDNLSLANIANNPAAYSTVTFRQGSYINMHVAVAADYRVYWLKKLYNEFRFGARLGYQLPVLRNGPWRFNDGSLGDLTAFRATMPYLQLGITLLPKSAKERRRGF